MKVTFIGTSSGLSVPHRSHASILFEGKNGGILVDCGEGTTHSLLRQNIDFDRINKIIISHTHPDHCSGIPLMIQYMHLTDRTKPIDIYLPKGTKNAFQQFFHQLYMISETHPFDYALLEYDEGTLLKFGDLTLSSIPNCHLEGKNEIAQKYNISIATFSLIISDRMNTVYYSADLKDINDLNPPSESNVMIVECTHIEMGDAANLAKNRGIKRLIFTHVPPELEIAPQLTIPGIQIDIALDGKVINFN